uniref:Uncharacterized protein n=1 Tax=Anguilla anguilla TaxID=7936 RepID=A0A0E9S6C0_ANGAN
MLRAHSAENICCLGEFNPFSYKVAGLEFTHGTTSQYRTVADMHNNVGLKFDC